MSQVRPGRRRLLPRISIRLLMILVLLSGATAPYFYRVRVQRDAVRAIEAAGGQVVYDWQWNPDIESPEKTDAELVGWRRRVADLFGVDAVCTVKGVMIDCYKADPTARVTDEEIAQIGRLTSLQRLRLVAPSVSAAGAEPLGNLMQLEVFEVSDPVRSDLRPILTCLADLPRLKSMMVNGYGQDYLDKLSRLTRLETLLLIPNGSPIDDDGLARLAGLVRLKVLSISETRITGAGLGALGGMKGLEHLAINDSRIDDLTPLLQLPELGSLCLWNCNIDDADLATMAKMNRLEAVILGNAPQLTDSGLAHLRESPGLQRLFFGQTSIADAGLRSLVGLKSLNYLSLGASRITPGGIAEFKKARPSVTVED